MSTQTETAGLATAAQAAGFAPSIHNTQPWRWRVSGPTLQLWAVRDRQLAVTDPSGRMLAISCGAALHHARVALAAGGWEVDVVHRPDPRQSDFLAQLTIRQRGDVAPAAMRLLQTARIRHTDRRPVSDTPVEQSTIDELIRVAEREGAHLHVLRRADVIALAGAASHAQQVEDMDPEWAEEIAYWAGGARGDGLGIPDNVIPSGSPATTVPARDFGRAGTLPIGTGHDREARYAILYGDADDETAWLRAGEALSAVWLEATERALSVVPLSAVVEVPQTRHVLTEMLSHLGQPFLALRLGHPDPDHAGPPHTPRLPADQTVEVVG